MGHYPDRLLCSYKENRGSVSRWGEGLCWLKHELRALSRGMWEEKLENREDREATVHWVTWRRHPANSLWNSDVLVLNFDHFSHSTGSVLLSSSR